VSEKRDFYRELIDNLYDGVYFVGRERRILFWNKGAETMTGYEAKRVVGRYCFDNILHHTDADGLNLCTSRCPLADTIRDGQARQIDVFMRHKDGHRVPVRVRATPLRNEHGDITGAIEVFSDNSGAAAAQEKIHELEQLALLDPLTSLGNRRFATLQLQDKLNTLQRYGWPFGLLFFDIDHFKEVNDRLGHEAGDRILTMVAKTAAFSVRAVDSVARWGGDEFVSILANVNRETLMKVAKKIVALVAASSLQIDGTEVNVTASVGATFARRDDTIDSLIARADALMYRSKNEGGNCVSGDS
jgi:diguanylate cyclase (GGDEF)-like protein/PAS domain S-box-containing protein